MDDFAALKAAVEGRLARTDIPADVYALATAEINATLRLREMESSASITLTSGAGTLPSDFLEVRSVYFDNAQQTPLDAASGFVKNATYEGSGVPAQYVIEGTSIRVNPVPSGSEGLEMRYVARLAAFSADDDTNTILTRYPALYLYSACKHAAIWAQDAELAATYAAAYEGEKARVEKRDRAARYGGGPLRVWSATAP
jgi:hypothetical protein